MGELLPKTLKTNGSANGGLISDGVLATCNHAGKKRMKIVFQPKDIGVLVNVVENNAWGSMFILTMSSNGSSLGYVRIKRLSISSSYNNKAIAYFRPSENHIIVELEFPEYFTYGNTSVFSLQPGVTVVSMSAISESEYNSASDTYYTEATVG